MTNRAQQYAGFLPWFGPSVCKRKDGIHVLTGVREVSRKNAQSCFLLPERAFGDGWSLFILAEGPPTKFFKIC